jgi:hypothetical protein
MTTSAERMRALRERRRRGLSKLRIQVSEDDLRQIVQAGCIATRHAAPSRNYSIGTVGLAVTKQEGFAQAAQMAKSARRRYTVTSARSPSPIAVAP